MIEFRKGDIVCNVFAGKNNPGKYLLYMGKCTIKQGRYRSKGYYCIDYAGERVELFREPDPLIFVGHMQEFDTFMSALERLRTMNMEVDCEKMDAD